MTSTNTNVVAKFAAVVAGLGLVAMSFASFAPAKAATEAEMQAQITQLLATIASLQAQMGGSSNASTAQLFTSDLTLGSTGPEVTSLQGWLISKGFAIPAGATGYFGAQTQSALAAYQASVAISPAAGYFGPITRAKVNAELGAGGNTGTGPIPGSGGLSGGAGSVDSYDLVGGLSGEEVGEDEEDVEVAGLEIEADDGSDLEITAVRLVFVQTDDNSGQASEDFEDVAAEVSVWLDGEEVGREDGEEFNDDNDFTKTVSLEDAIIEAGETAELTVAISGVSNLDGDDEDSAWSVDFRQIRYEDADGATISEDPTEDPRTFSFVSFASATDAELRISLTDGDEADDVNEGDIVQIDATDTTDDVVLLAFTAEVRGDSDLTVDDFPVIFTSTNANVDELVFEARLMLDGEEVGSETFSSSATTTEVMTFEDLDLTLEAGEEYDFTVEAEIAAEDDTNADAGDTIRATIPEAILTQADIEDEAGEDLPDNDRNGSALSDAKTLFVAGPVLELVSTDAEVTTQGEGTISDIGTFTIEFDVTALEQDVWVDKSAPETSGGSGESDLTVTGTGSVSAVIDCADCTEGSDGFKVNEGETERFTVTVSIQATADGFFKVALASLAYALDDDDATAYYTSNLTEFETKNLYLNDN